MGGWVVDEFVDGLVVVVVVVLFGGEARAGICSGFGCGDARCGGFGGC